MPYGLPSLQRVASLSAFIGLPLVTKSKTKRKRKKRVSKPRPLLMLLVPPVIRRSQVSLILKSKESRHPPPPPPPPPPQQPTEKQPEPFQQDNDKEVANDEGEWTVVKRKKPRATGCVSKTLLKLRAPRHVWKNMSSSESSCPSENEVDDTAAPATIATPDHLKSPCISHC